MRDFLKEFLHRKGFEVKAVEDGSEAFFLIRGEKYALVFADSRTTTTEGATLLQAAREVSPDTRFVAMTADATVENAVEAMRLGACDYLVKPFRGEQVEQLIDRVLKGDDTNSPNGDGESAGADGQRALIGESPQMKEIRGLIKVAASTDATVLITGETGTGKELVAREIFKMSRRQRGRFVRLNCAALPESLYESELFGHERGAFTGAVRQKKGRFELAHNGTLLMDEISEINWSVQAKLLRVLQEKEFERVGGTSTIRADTRVIATTNKDLAKEIRERRFRSDLYYRLSVFPITVPPLRERRSDIRTLSDYFLRIHCSRNNIGLKEISDPAMKMMMKYSWPGNIRQLENCLERAVLVSAGPVIRPEDLPDLVLEMEEDRHGEMPAALEPVAATIRDMETVLLLRTLDEVAGNRTLAAEKLGITTRTLRNKLHRLGQMDYLKPGRDGKKIPTEKGKKDHPAESKERVLTQKQA